MSSPVPASISPRRLLAALALVLCGACGGDPTPPPKKTWTVDKPAVVAPVAVKKRHPAHEHAHGAHPHPGSDHHHHPHPHPHLAGADGHHHPY
jgi:hypothetical protein